MMVFWFARIFVGVFFSCDGLSNVLLRLFDLIFFVFIIYGFCVFDDFVGDLYVVFLLIIVVEFLFVGVLFLRGACSLFL